MENIKLIYPTMEYEEQILDYIKEFKENGEVIHGGAKMEHNASIADWISSVENNRSEETVENNLMPASNFILVKEDENKMLGVVDIRHRLNDFLLKRGGHIGYSIKKSERKKGYGFEILRLALLECKKLGIERVLVTCDKDNIASAKIIQKNGGILENEIDIHGKPLQRYWIEL